MLLRSLFVITVCFLLSTCHRPGTTRPTPATPADLSSGSDEAVVVFEAQLRSGPGQGATVGSLQPNVVVRVSQETDGWLLVECHHPLRIHGWVRKERIGCRALSEAELTPQDPSSQPATRLRPGALLAVHHREGARLDVETQGAISLRGWVPAEICGVGQPFVPTLPTDGRPHRLTQQANMTTIAPEMVIMVPLGQRFAVAQVEENLARGRTDGAVVVQGSLPLAVLEQDKTTPFDRLAQPLGYTHEVLQTNSLRAHPAGDVLTELPGGTALNINRSRDGWSHVRTYGLVQLEGWIEQQNLRRVSLDYNQLDPEARRREHVPFDRSWPRE
jgi:SH3-like domain-containing protein